FRQPRGDDAAGIDADERVVHEAGDEARPEAARDPRLSGRREVGHADAQLAAIARPERGPSRRGAAHDSGPADERGRGKPRRGGLLQGADGGRPVTGSEAPPRWSTAATSRAPPFRGRAARARIGPRTGTDASVRKASPSRATSRSASAASGGAAPESAKAED